MTAGFILSMIWFPLILSEKFDHVEMRSIGPWSGTKLHTMRSRRVLAHDANLILLKKPHVPPTLISTHNTNPRNISLFLVRVETCHRTEMLTELQRVSTFVRYFSKDRFVAALSADDLSTLFATEIFELPSALKLQPELYSTGRQSEVSEAQASGYRTRRSGAESKCAAAQLNVALISTTTDSSSIKNEIESLCSEPSEQSNMTRSLCRLQPGSGSLRKMVVDTDECVQSLAAERLAGHPLVTWVEIRRTMRLRNKYATRIVQSKNGSSWTLWGKGLMGEGEVVFKFCGVEITPTYLVSFDCFETVCNAASLSRLSE
jgi:hypothetical protein